MRFVLFLLSIVFTKIRPGSLKDPEQRCSYRSIHSCQVLVCDNTMFTRNMLGRDYHFDMIRYRSVVERYQKETQCLDAVQTADLDSCVEECLSVSRCKAVTFHLGRKGSNHTCYLHEKGAIEQNEDIDKDISTYEDKNYIHATRIKCAPTLVPPLGVCGKRGDQFQIPSDTKSDQKRDQRPAQKALMSIWKPSRGQKPSQESHTETSKRLSQDQKPLTEARSHSWPWFVRLAIYIGDTEPMRFCGGVILEIPEIAGESDILVAPASCVSMLITDGLEPSPYVPKVVSSKLAKAVLKLKDQDGTDLPYCSSAKTEQKRAGQKFLKVVKQVKQLASRRKFKIVTVDPGNVEISAGKHDEAKFEPGEQHVVPVQVQVHPNFSYTPEKGFMNDVALLKVPKAIQYSDTVGPSCLSTKGESLRKGNPPPQCFAVGWECTKGNGIRRSGTLHEAATKVSKNSVCRDIWSNLLETSKTILKKVANGATWLKEQEGEQMLCTGLQIQDPEICIADEGAMLTCEDNGAWRLQGIASYLNKELRIPGRPAAFVRVSTFTKWISGSAKSMTGLLKKSMGRPRWTNARHRQPHS